MKKTILSAFILLNFVISIQLLGESEFFPFSMLEYFADLEEEKKELKILIEQNNKETSSKTRADFMKQGDKKALKVQKAFELIAAFENFPDRTPSGVTRFLDEAEEILKPLADKGVSYAQLWLGYLYEMGKKNYELAEKYYKLGADRGYFDHHEGLGRLYRKQKKYDLAEKHLLFVINDPIFYNGKIKKEDTDRYSILYESSLELGRVYSVQKKYDLARKYYEIAIGGGRGDASDALDELEKQINEKKK